MSRRASINQTFPSRRTRKKAKAKSDYYNSLFTLLPYDDTTAAEEFGESMIRENKLMIDIKNKGINSK